MIGIFVGSFNPPTLAHLKICLKLQKQFKKIVFVPVNSKEKQLISLEQRIAMLNIYTKKYSFLAIDDVMKDYAYFDYHILDMLKKKYGNIQIILGSDLLDNLSTFDNFEYILANNFFVVITRFSYNTLDIIKMKYAKYQNHFTILDFKSNLSSSMARELLQKNLSCKGVLDKQVEKYIRNHHLYV